MKIQTINNINNTTFKNTSSQRTINTALLILDQDNVHSFKKNHEIAVKAGSIDVNPFTALGYKLYRTFRYILGKNTNQPKKFSKIA